MHRCDRCLRYTPATYFLRQTLQLCNACGPKEIKEVKKLIKKLPAVSEIDAPLRTSFIVKRSHFDGLVDLN